MKTNKEKCHLIVSRNELTEIQIETFQLKIVAAKSCQVLTLIANLILIVILTIYAIK